MQRVRVGVIGDLHQPGVKKHIGQGENQQKDDHGQNIAATR